jgi:hypothetical protein
MGQSTPLPFDAEVDYVTVPAGAYVDPDVEVGGSFIDFSVTFRFPTNGTQAEGAFRCGMFGGDSSSTIQIFINDGTGKIKGQKFSTALAQLSNASFIGSFDTARTNGTYFYAGSNSAGLAAGATSAKGYKLLVCAVGASGGDAYACINDIDVKDFSIYENGIYIRDLVPVRVGTVGYLYDKVTGRLFGSATSTALVPGPDKAVPTITTPGRIVELTDSPAFTGTPTAPTAAAGTNTTQIATTAFVQTAVGGKLASAERNLLAYAATTTLDPATAVYRSALNNDGTFPTITDSGIPTASAYFAFELELTVPSTVPSTITGPTGWTWMDGGNLPDPSDLSGGETIYIACRLDCTARTIVANCYDVR